jgi:hypothetical protein
MAAPWQNTGALIQQVLPQGGLLVRDSLPMVGDLWRLQEELT